MRSRVSSLLVVSVLLPAFVLTGCKTAHVHYSLASVQPVAASCFSSQALLVDKFRDSRYTDKKSVSSYVKKSGMYGSYNGGTHTTGLRPTPDMSDYREIFRGVAYSPETSYYCAPDRLYWVPNGPLTEMREMLARHIEATRLFGVVTMSDGVPADYVLKLEAKRFLTLKERRPIVDVFAILWTGFLFSSDEVVSARVEWSLVRQSDGRVVTSGIADCGSIESHHCFSAKNTPFKLNNRAARQIGDQIVRSLANAARGGRGGAEHR